MTYQPHGTVNPLRLKVSNNLYFTVIIANQLSPIYILLQKLKNLIYWGTPVFSYHFRKESKLFIQTRIWINRSTQK